METRNTVNLYDLDDPRFRVIETILITVIHRPTYPSYANYEAFCPELETYADLCETEDGAIAKLQHAIVSNILWLEQMTSSEGVQHRLSQFYKHVKPLVPPIERLSPLPPPVPVGASF